MFLLEIHKNASAAVGLCIGSLAGAYRPNACRPVSARRSARSTSLGTGNQTVSLLRWPDDHRRLADAGSWDHQGQTVFDLFHTRYILRRHAQGLALPLVGENT